MLSFTLPDDFVEQYQDRPVDWGYKDAGGNSLGEITFLRTYSRLKDNGEKERWHEVCRRVIEGMFSIQKDHCKANRLPWNDHKAQRSARDAYERMFTFRWTPPGRGLWMMGTPLVNLHKNSAALQNCFTADTKFITRDGVRTLGEMAGQDVEVYADNEWHKASVESFGVQPVQRVTFAPFGRRSNHRVVETVTPNHRWELRDGTLTTDLKVGDVVPASVVSENAHYDAGYYVDAWRHGLIFADGSINYTYKNGDYSHMMRLRGAKAVHVDVFEKISYQPNCDGDPVVYHRSATNMKALPATTDPCYLASFVAGWLAMDGRDVGGGNRQVATQDPDAAAWLLENAASAGYVVLGVSHDDRDTNFGPRSAPVTLITLGEDADYWTVKAIEPLDEPVPVFCAVVPDIERFTLASGIYTSNCGFVSTADMTKVDPAGPFCWLMEASMLGVGIGFDDKGADKDFTIYQPDGSKAYAYQVPDSREGWVESLRLLLESYLLPAPGNSALGVKGRGQVLFDYHLIRAAGEPIKTFGGTAAGPGPLRRLHRKIVQLFEGRATTKLTRTDIADIGNLIGVCVVSGNVRRSAELLIGHIDDKEFINLKNYEIFPDRNYWSEDPAEADKTGWGWMSNNSVEATVGSDYSHLVDAIALNGEPGIIWMDVTRKYGRLIDPPNNKDWRAAGYNPCAEQSLESYEMCTLVETYLNRHDSLEDFQQTLKYAFMYAKTVTLLPTHWQRTNAIMQRNRRIGCSISGIANFADNRGMTELRTWLNEGYQTVQNYDRTYSEWLCVRESIKTTTVKPSGTVSILAGESPGVHWAPGGEYFDRAIRFSKDDPMVATFRASGYRVEPDVKNSETTVVVYFPVHSNARRAEGDVSLFEKANLAVVAQRYWSDNSVSVTLSFNPETEAQHIGTVLHMHEGQLKTVSFLPKGNKVYPQQPYTEITVEDYEDATMKLLRLDLDPIYKGNALDAAGESYCTTDACEVKTVTLNSSGKDVKINDLLK